MKWLRRLAAIIALAATIAVLWAAYTPLYDYHERYHANYSEHKQGTGHGVTDVLITIRDGVEAHHDLWIVIETFALVLFTATLWISTRELQKTTAEHAQHLEGAAKSSQIAADAALAANIANREFFAATERPWLSLAAEVTSNLTWIPAGARFEVTFTIYNVGRSPARNVRLGFEAIQAVGNRGIASVIVRVIDGARNQWRGSTIFPGAPLRQNVVAILTHQEIDEGIASMPHLSEIPITRRILVPSIIACVGYEFPFAVAPGDFHFTLIQGHIVRRGPDGALVLFADSTATTVPQNELGITAGFMSGVTDAT